jgi:outer membrane protein TolC
MRLLYQVCGLNDSVVHNLSVPVIEKVELSNPMMSPLFMQYKIDSFKISNEKIAVGNNYRPKLNWFADAGFNSGTLPGVYQHFGFSAGINLSVPIYDGHQRKFQIEKLSISEDSRSHYETFFKNQYSSQVQQLNNELAVSKDVTLKLKKQLATAEELLTLSKNQLNVGNIGIAEFINALKSYKSINHELNQSQVKTLLILNELNYLMMQ